ncbi:MAG: prepilin-type N-terminal cleavage/methylation domain-containing protein [Planctomycetota bacterium]|nr:type II secretion system GspH family protein [Planctomycetota bacterium]
MQQQPSSRLLAYPRRGTTLLEVLASLAIISVLLALVIPAVSAGRKEAGVTQCLSNLKGIATTGLLYSKDNAERLGLESFPALPWHLGFDTPWGSVGLISEFIYGGYRTTAVAPGVPENADFRIIPTEARPFNKYIAPGIGGTSPLRQYVCPADGWERTPTVGEEPPEADESISSWEANGNSYALNWYWVEGSPSYDVYSSLDEMHAYGTAMLSKKIGALASKFVVFMEGAMNAYMYDARPPDGSEGESPIQTLGMGWHGRHSTYSMAMWDGHAEYRFIDTRFTSDYGYNTWPEPNTPWPQFKKNLAGREE